MIKYDKLSESDLPKAILNSVNPLGVAILERRRPTCTLERDNHHYGKWLDLNLEQLPSRKLRNKDVNGA